MAREGLCRAIAGTSHWGASPHRLRTAAAPAIAAQLAYDSGSDGDIIR